MRVDDKYVQRLKRRGCEMAGQWRPAGFHQLPCCVVSSNLGCGYGGAVSCASRAASVRYVTASGAAGSGLAESSSCVPRCGWRKRVRKRQTCICSLPRLAPLCSYLHDGAMMQNSDFMRALHRGEAMRDHEHSSAGAGCSKRRLYSRLRRGVERARRLVEQQYARVLMRREKLVS